MRRVRFIVAIAGLCLAATAVVSFYRARTAADAAAGVGDGVATRRHAHLWRLQRDGWPGARWVWAFDYSPADPAGFADAQVYVSPAGQLVDTYNVAALRRHGRGR